MYPSSQLTTEASAAGLSAASEVHPRVAFPSFSTDFLFRRGIAGISFGVLWAFIPVNRIKFLREKQCFQAKHMDCELTTRRIGQVYALIVAQFAKLLPRYDSQETSNGIV